MSFAFVFPGQGSQSVGMLGALATADSAVRATFDEASRVLGFDMWKLVSEGPEEALNATERTQPAMLAAGVAVWRVWRARGGALPEVVCGHSLGEFTALVCAESLSFGATVELVRFRGQVMQEAVPAGSGAMAAIIGLDDEAIEAACREAAQGAVVEAANFNGAGQVVIAGEKAAVQRGALVGHPARSDRGRDRAGDRMRAGQGAHGPEPPYRAARGPGFSGAGGPGLHRGRTRVDPRGFPCLRTKSHSSPGPRAASGTPSRSPSEGPARG